MWLLFACDAPKDTRAPTVYPPEPKVVQVLTHPASAWRVEVVATVHAIDHPPRTAGWEGSEWGPMPTAAAEGWVETWLDVRAVVPGLTPVIADQPEPEGYPLVSGKRRDTIDATRADQGTVSVPFCWSADGTRLALRADAAGATGAWVVYDFAAPVRIGQAWDGSGTCEAALAQSIATWHPTR